MVEGGGIRRLGRHVQARISRSSALARRLTRLRHFNCLADIWGERFFMLIAGGLALLVLICLLLAMVETPPAIGE